MRPTWAVSSSERSPHGSSNGSRGSQRAAEMKAIFSEEAAISRTRSIPSSDRPAPVLGNKLADVRAHDRSFGADSSRRSYGDTGAPSSGFGVRSPGRFFQTGDRAHPRRVRRRKRLEPGHSDS